MRYRLVKGNASEFIEEAKYRIDSIITHAGVESCTAIKYGYFKSDEVARQWFNEFIERKANGDSGIAILEEREV